MQKKNLLKAICVALVAISFSCSESTTKTPVEDTTKKDTGDRNVKPLPSEPPPSSN